MSPVSVQVMSRKAALPEGVITGVQQGSERSDLAPGTRISDQLLLSGLRHTEEISNGRNKP